MPHHYLAPVFSGAIEIEIYGVNQQLIIHSCTTIYILMTNNVTIFF